MTPRLSLLLERLKSNMNVLIKYRNIPAMLSTTGQHSTGGGLRSTLRPCMTFRILWDTSEPAHEGQACRHNAACKLSSLRLHSLHTGLLNTALQSPMLPDCRLGRATAQNLLQPAQARCVVLSTHWQLLKVLWSTSNGTHQVDLAGST